jgi:hypothetical protein
MPADALSRASLPRRCHVARRRCRHDVRGAAGRTEVARRAKRGDAQLLPRRTNPLRCALTRMERPSARTVAFQRSAFSEGEPRRGVADKLAGGWRRLIGKPLMVRLAGTKPLGSEPRQTRQRSGGAGLLHARRRSDLRRSRSEPVSVRVDLLALALWRPTTRSASAGALPRLLQILALMCWTDCDDAAVRAVRRGMDPLTARQSCGQSAPALSSNRWNQTGTHT